MPKQRLESDFKDRLDKNPWLWVLKLQVEKRSYTSIPGDFIILSERYRYLVECKENKSKSYSFNRSNQIKKLESFYNKHDKNHAFFLINFWQGSKKKSLYYLIPITKYIEFETLTGKKSGNINDFNTYLSEYQVYIDEISLYFE